MPKTKDETITIPDVGDRSCDFVQPADGAVEAFYRVKASDGRDRHTAFTVPEVVIAWGTADPEAPTYAASLATLKAANPTIDGTAFAAAVQLVMAAMVSYGDGKIGFS